MGQRCRSLKLVGCPDSLAKSINQLTTKFLESPFQEMKMRIEEKLDCSSQVYDHVLAHQHTPVCLDIHHTHTHLILCVQVLPGYVSEHHLPQRLEEGTGHLGTGFTDSCELVGAGT